MSKPQVLLLVAMPEEVQALTRHLARSAFHVVETGVGKVQAAYAATRAILEYRPSALVSLGTSGALAPGLEIGHIVVADAVVQHDVDVTALGFPRGDLPSTSTRLPLDAQLCHALAAAARHSLGRGAVHVGVVASGDQFIASPLVRADIHGTFGALCVDMESAAVAFVAHRCQVPFAALRSISDRADGTAAQDFPTFLASACARLAAVLEAWWETDLHLRSE